jgi:hypothetical protein
MADLYARQNLHERALRLYRRLLERTPHDAGLADRVREMEARIGAGTVGTAALPTPIAELSPSPIEGPMEVAVGATSETPPEVAPAAPTETPPEAPADEAMSAPAEPSAGARTPARPTRRPTNTDVETLARDWAEGPGDVGELSTPFAWATRPAARPAEPPARDSTGRPIGDYFRSLLRWEPGMEPEVATAAPEAEPPPSGPAGVEAVQAAAVDAVTAVETAAAQAVTAVQAAAIDAVTAVGAAAVEAAAAPPAPAAVPHAAVPIEAVPIESLAPTIVDIAALAPHVVDIATLAPERPAGTGPSGWMDPLR